MDFKRSEKVICAFCKLSRRIYRKKEVTLLDVAVLLAITALLSFTIWDGPDLRSMLIFMALAFMLQIFLRVRYRESIKCPHCGFDPIVYKKNPEQAAKRVRTYLEKRRDNPQFLLKPQPRIEPIYLTADQIQKLENSLVEMDKNQVISDR